MARRLPLIVALLALFSCATRDRPARHGASVRPSVRWEVTVAPDLRLTERVCWDGFAPGHVRPEMPKALPFVTASSDDGRPLAMDAEGVPLAATTGCVRLAIDLERMARTLDDETAVTHVGDAIYGSFDPWLWRTGVWPDDVDGRLTIRTPPGITMSLPHPLRSDGSYRILISTWTFMARFALGRLTTDEVSAAGGKLAIVSLPGAASSSTRDGLRKAVAIAAVAASSVDVEAHRAATTPVQVLLLPARARGGRRDRSDPITFGMAMRGGGASVALRIADDAKDDELFGEWVATHELSHLWLPPVSRDGAWLSEGLATYHQCMLRSRAGIYDEARAWDELLAGFDRGRRQAGDVSLRDAQRHRFQHIYWGGAAILFKLDVALRKRGSSLDRVITAVRRSMPSDADESTVDEMLARFERVLGFAIRPWIAEWLARPFVDTATELDELGVARRGDAIVFENAAPFRDLRVALSGRDPLAVP